MGSGEWRGKSGKEVLRSAQFFLAPAHSSLAPEKKGGDPPQLHPGTRSHCYRCSLPGLAEFTAVRREGTRTGHHGAGIILMTRPLSYARKRARTYQPAYCMKDLDFMDNILSGTKYCVSPEGVSLMDETNNLAKQVGRSPADS